MKIFSSLLDNDSKFRKPNDIKNTVSTSKNYKNESVDSAKVLNFFQTSKQKSYIVATDKMVYCIVDDVRKEHPKVNWSERKENLAGTIISTSSKTDKTGYIDFGDNHKNWLYTKSKFENESVLKEKIRKLLVDDT